MKIFLAEKLKDWIATLDDTENMGLIWFVFEKHVLIKSTKICLVWFFFKRYFEKLF